MWQQKETMAELMSDVDDIARRVQVKAGVAEALWQSLTERFGWDALKDLALYALTVEEEARARGALMRALIRSGTPTRAAYLIAFFQDEYQAGPEDRAAG